MSRFNTGNPLGSGSPLDLDDNAKNMDEAVNAEQDTFQDRMGNSRLTWAGIVKAGTGDAGVIVPVVQQAVQDVIDGVDGQIAVAENAADRAETARDAAFVTADVYPDVATGRAAVANGEQFQVVGGDEFVRYRRDTASTQTEVGRYPSSGKVDDIPAQTDLSAPDAEQLVDDIGQLIRRTDADGHVFVPHLDDTSIQQRVNEDREAISQGTGFRRKDVFQVEDDAGKITMRQNEDGAVYIPGLPSSIQSALGYSVGEPVRYPTNPREKLHDLIYPMVQNLAVQGLPYIDPPALLVPNRYDVPDSFVSAFTMDSPDPARGLWLETPHGPGGLVHPYLLEMRKPLNGYRYLFGDTPHLSGASEENPCLWGSNNLRDFTLWPGIQNPLGQPPMGPDATWNADIGFTYDPRNGELICFWIGTDNNGDPFMHYRSTWDGVNWTPEMWVAGNDLSPSILYDPVNDIWHQWNTVYPQGGIRHLTGPNYYGPWTQVSTTSAPGLWHSEVKYMGDKFVVLVNTTATDQKLYLGVSEDGDNWTFGPDLFTTPPPAVYKGSFLPEWDGNELRLTVAWNAYKFPRPEGVAQNLYIEPTNWVDVTTLL